MASNNLQVRLVFWPCDELHTLEVVRAPTVVSNAVAKLLEPDECQWIYGGCDIIADIPSGGSKICLTIRHKKFKVDDVLAENVIESFCEYIFKKDSVLDLDRLLTEKNLVMGPFSDTPMNVSDRTFGRCFSLQQLKQLKDTEGLGFFMQNVYEESNKPIMPNASKWCHAPLYAGICVTNLFKFIDGPINEISEQTIDKISETCVEDLQGMFQQGKWLLDCAKVFSLWSPGIHQKIEAQIKKLDPTKKKEILYSKTMSLSTGGSMLSTLMQGLGDTDPDVLQSRRIHSIMAEMIGACEPLHYATLDYIDSCKSNTVKSAAFTVAGIGLYGLLAATPPAGIVALGSWCTGVFASGGLVGWFGVETVHNGVALHNSLHLKIVIRQIYITLASSKLFLLLTLYQTLESLDRNSTHYQYFKDAMDKQFKADLGQLTDPGYVNRTIQRMVKKINSHIQLLKDDISVL